MGHYGHYVTRVPTLPGKPGILSFSGKYLEFAQKVVKTWNFNSKLGKKTLKFANSMFQASFFKMSFTKIILIYFFVISTLSTKKLIEAKLTLDFITFSWK